MTSVTPERRERYRDALAVPEFRVIFAAQTISFLGLMMAEFAVSVLVFRRTGSPFLTALVLALSFMPHLFSGTLFSSLVDRIPIRRLMVGCNVLIATLAAVMALPGLPVAALLGLVFSIGMVAPILAGARAATLPEVLPGPAYVPGRSLMRMISQTAQIAGLGLGGLLLTVIEPSDALLIESAAFLIAATLLRFGTRERPPAPSSGSSMLKDSVSGIREVLAVKPLRRNLMLAWCVAPLVVAPEALANPYAAERGLSTAELGLMMAAGPLGCCIGEFAAMWRLTAARQVKLIVPLACLTLIPLLGYALKPGFFGVAGILLVAGMGVAHHLGLDHHLMEVTPERLRSRALALQSTGLMFTQGLGFALAGAAGQFAAVSTIVPAAAALGLLAILMLRPTG